MQPSNPLNTRMGSFAKPEPRAQPQAAPQPAPEQEKPVMAAAPVADEPAQPLVESLSEEEQEAKDALEREQAVKRIIETITKELDIALTTEDLKNYIMRGRISKEVSLVNGIVKGTFQSLKIEDLQAIDARMAEVRDKSKYTVKGLENEEAIIVLSYSWTHADGKPLGDTPEKREAVIRKMGSLFIERASNARVSFDTLIRLAMQERGLIKK